MAGAALIVSGLTQPVYTNFDTASELVGSACADGPPGREWYVKMEALRTWRHPLMQAGASLILLALVVPFLRWKVLPSSQSPTTTPAKRSTFLLLGTAALALVYFAQIDSLKIDLRRNVFPLCADSIGMPIYGMTLMMPVVWAACLVAGAIIARHFGPLPVSLAAWDRARSRRSWLIAIVTAPLFGIVLLIGLTSAASSAFVGTPAYVVLLYLIASVRAALTAPKGIPPTQ